MSLHSGHSTPRGLLFSPDASGGGGSAAAPGLDRATIERELGALNRSLGGGARFEQLPFSEAARVLGIATTSEPDAAAVNQAAMRADAVLTGASRERLLPVGERDKLLENLGKVEGRLLALIEGRAQIKTLLDAVVSDGRVSLSALEGVVPGAADPSPDKTVQAIQRWRSATLVPAMDSNKPDDKLLPYVALYDLDTALRSITPDTVKSERHLPEIAGLVSALTPLSIKSDDLEKIRVALKLDFADADSEVGKIARVSGRLVSMKTDLPSDEATFAKGYPVLIGISARIDSWLKECEERHAEELAKSKRTDPSPSPAPDLPERKLGIVEERERSLSEKLRKFIKPWMKALEVGGLVAGVALAAWGVNAGYDLAYSALGSGNLISAVIGTGQTLVGSLAGFSLFNAFAGMLGATAAMSATQTGMRYLVRKDVDDCAEAIATSGNDVQYVEEKTKELFVAFTDRLSGKSEKPSKFPKFDKLITWCSDRIAGKRKDDALGIEKSKLEILEIINSIGPETVGGKRNLGDATKALDEALLRIPVMHAYCSPSFYSLFSNSAGTDLGQLYMRSMAHLMMQAAWTRVNWGGLDFTAKQQYPQRMQNEVKGLIKNGNLDDYIVRYTNPVMMGISDWLRLGTGILPAALLTKVGWGYATGAGK